MGVSGFFHYGSLDARTGDSLTQHLQLLGQGETGNGVWHLTVRVHMHGPQDKPESAGAPEEPK